ncbi:hypothetical protein UFOVP724_88 [uncultured Caudovirales phage]|uniref:Uncharacterized protein n=1 Tax=uncultured Caudovirales phage TaxID=2100421 RepID=A0A6J5NMS6_9CAUD|nr:hypothetical protein UFOVP724_88 [uncultured Caudovirales phage]
MNPVYIMSALKLFTYNQEEYLNIYNIIDQSKADITKPVLITKQGRILKGWETLKYVLDSNQFINLYYQVVDKDYDENF